MMIHTKLVTNSQIKFKSAMFRRGSFEFKFRRS